MPQAVLKNKPERCVNCIEDIAGKAGYKLLREKLNHKSQNHLIGMLSIKQIAAWKFPAMQNTQFSKLPPLPPPPPPHLSDMKSAIAAALFHVASTEEKPWHFHSPDGEASWCGFKSDLGKGTTLYKHGFSIKEIIWFMEICRHF